MGKVKLGGNRTKGKGKRPKVKERRVKNDVKKKLIKKKWKHKNDPEIKEKPKVDKNITTPKNSELTKTKAPPKLDTLRERMLKRLEAARFRQINEELDSTKDTNPLEVFSSNIQEFQKYHTAYNERKQHWPADPLDIIIKYIKKKVPKDRIVADFGCGEARLSQSVSHTVHSFDLFALNDRVTACDMSSTPLKDQSVDVAVFCLSLMGTDVGKYIAEANRILKVKGILKIAEVTSRFPNNNSATFVKRMKKFGFVNKDKQEANSKGDKLGLKRNEEVFLIFDFLKIRPVKQGKIPALPLSPCIYKKR